MILRYPGTCIDCGRSLSAGMQARWLGRGRVSCCPAEPIPSIAVPTFLTAETIGAFAEKSPTARIVVRLQSGARFEAMARDVAHIVRCVTESMQDKIRDVSTAEAQL